jgi:hypothetical protein
VFNLLGTLLPTVVALFCTRPIVGGLGHARFGVLSVAWTVISAIGIRDLGIGRALTRFLAVYEERDPEREASVVWTSLGVIFLLGCLGGSIAWGLAEVLGARLAHGDAAIRSEAVSVLRIAEDLDWQLRAGRGHSVAWLVADCLVHHKVGRSTGSTDERMGRLFMSQNPLKLARPYAGPRLPMWLGRWALEFLIKPTLKGELGLARAGLAGLMTQRTAGADIVARFRGRAGA